MTPPGVDSKILEQCSHHFFSFKAFISVNLAIINVKHVQIELNNLIARSISMGHGAVCGTDIRASSLKLGGVGGIGLYDRSTIVDSRSKRNMH